MKLHLPYLLLSALVAAQMCATATAATVVGSGVFYDNGKNAYSSDPSLPAGDKDDSYFCWATAGANMVQYWQDSYSQYHDQGQTPPSGISSNYTDPYGTSYLKVYQEALKVQMANKTGYHTEFIDWWFKGDEVINGSTSVLPSQDGYYQTLSGDSDISKRQLEFTEDKFADSLKSIFSTQGQIAGISFTSYNAEIMQSSRVHAVTCMGYETDSEGKVSALILADADDEYFGAVRVNVSYDKDVKLHYEFETPEGILAFNAPVGDCTVLSSDDINYDYGKYYVFMDKISGDLAQIVTPTSYTNEAGDVVTVAQTAEHANVDITKAAGTTTSLDASTTVTGNTVTVGDGSNIVVLTTDNGEKLSLDGLELAATGLKVKAGSLASLENVSVTGYADGGIDGVGHTAFHDGSLSVTNNTTEGNGAGATNASYMEISDNTVGVVFSGNKATGANSVGGGIENKAGAVLSIRGNKSANFSGNSATNGGNDIYNAGTAIVADNKSVVFASSENGKAAVTNDGTLYLANNSDQTIEFKGSKLDGSGITYIGKDNRSSAYTGAVKFTDGGDTNAMTVEKKTASVAAALENLSVSLNEINGTTASQSSISGAKVQTNGDLNVSKLTMDNTSSLKGNVITLSEVVIDLSNVDGTTGTDGALTYDLSGLLTASTVKLDNIVFDAHGIELTKDQEVVVTLGNNTLNGTAFLLTADGLREQTKLIDGSVHFSANSPIVPEPATTTLSLLALAGLCARRRRK